MIDMNSENFDNDLVKNVISTVTMVHWQFASYIVVLVFYLNTVGSE